MILSIYYVCKCIYFLNSSRALLKIILYDVGLLNKDCVNNKIVRSRPKSVTILQGGCGGCGKVSLGLRLLRFKFRIRVMIRINFLRMMTIIIYTNDDYHHT